MRRAWLHLTVFLCGAAVMAVEMTASRLLAPWYGSSFDGWTMLVGVVLAVLTFGYAWGGALAERDPSPAGLYRAVALTGLLVLGLPHLGAALLPVVALRLGLGVVGGTGLAVLLLLGPPTALLATVSPRAVRAGAADPRLAGGVAGRIYACSTLGSVLGTALPGLVLLPLLGTQGVFHGIGGALVGVGAVGAALERGAGEPDPAAGPGDPEAGEPGEPTCEPPSP